MSDEFDITDAEIINGLRFDIETLRNERDSLKQQLTEALAKRDQQIPPTIRGTFAIDLDNPLAEGLVLECLDNKTLAYTARHYHMKACRGMGDSLKRTIERDEAKDRLATAEAAIALAIHTIENTGGLAVNVEAVRWLLREYKTKKVPE